jgi:hypothetical protein
MKTCKKLSSAINTDNIDALNYLHSLVAQSIMALMNQSFLNESITIH